MISIIPPEKREAGKGGALDNPRLDGAKENLDVGMKSQLIWSMVCRAC